VRKFCAECFFLVAEATIMNLPPCHSRRLIVFGGSAFFCAHPSVHAPNHLVTPEVCAACSHWREPPPPVFRPVELLKPRGRCLHLGGQTGLRECPSCLRKVLLKVFACAHPRHEETTLAECAKCPDHAPAPAGALAV
jgi:hypothetical protein